jgi:hypothetical protein
MTDKGKGKTVQLQAWSGTEVSRKFPDFMTMAQDVGKVVSLTHRPPLHPESNLVLISVRAWGSVVVKALRYKSEGHGIDSPGSPAIFPWHLTVPCALGSTQPLKMSTRIIVGVKAAGA